MEKTSVRHSIALLENPDHLRRLRMVAKEKEIEVFPVLGPHFVALLKCVSRFSKRSFRLIGMLDFSAIGCIRAGTDQSLINFLEEAMTFARQIRKLFVVSELTIQVVHDTIQFFLATLDELLNHEQDLIVMFRDHFQVLKENLEFLFTLIGTLPDHGIHDLEAPLHTAGNFLYFFFLSGNLKLSDLTKKIKSVLTIAEYYKNYGDPDSNSVFIAKYLLDHLEDLIESRPGRGSKGKPGALDHLIKILYMELIFWRPFLNEADVPYQSRHIGEDVLQIVENVPDRSTNIEDYRKDVLQIVDLTEYIIGRYMIEEAPLWFLSSVTEDIEAVARSRNLRQSESFVPYTFPTLKQVLEIEDLQMVMPHCDFDGRKIKTCQYRKRLISVAIRYMMKLCIEDQTPYDSLDSFWECWKHVAHDHSEAEDDKYPKKRIHSEAYDDKYPKERISVQKFSGLIRLLVQKELAQIFGLQKLQSSDSGKPNELLVVFIEFLSNMVDEILEGKIDMAGPLTDQTSILSKELKYLIPILGDSPLSHIELEETKSLLAYIEDLVNAIGSYLYFILSNDEVTLTRMNLALSLLLGKFEHVKEKIKDNCIRFSELRLCSAPKTATGLFFIFDSLVADLESLMTCKADLIVDMKDQIKSFQEKLSVSNSILKGIKVQQHEGLEDLKELITQAVEETCGAEYIINSFVTGDAPVWYLTLRVSHIEEKLNLLVKEATKISGRDASGVEIVTDPGEAISRPNELPILRDHDFCVGFQEEAKTIAGVLVDGQKQRKIVSIFGMPGLGKTTLARKVFNAPSMVYWFDRKAWCVVSQTYNRRKLLIDILILVDNLDRGSILEEDDEKLSEQLYKCLKGRRYLIVLDDVWDIKPWDDLRRYLPDDDNGSRILFTSRNKDVALQASTDSVIHELRFLTESECWDLLQQKVFKKECCPHELEIFGKKVVQLCHGLPLAVVTISSILANNKRKDFWQKVVENLSSYLSDDSNNCMRILELSYEHLPVHLKPCFLYMGAFPEDMEIPVRKLKSLWIYEGFIGKGEKSLEEVAEHCLRELIDRSLVVVSQRRSDGGIKACNMHDLIRDLCLKRAEEENFLNIIKGHVQLCSVVHHSKPLSLRISSLLGYLPRFVSNKLRLRVLDSWARSKEDFTLEENELPVTLRYLGISCLWPSVYSLNNLEFLHVHSEMCVIDESLLNMKKLRHLRFSQGAYFSGSCKRQAVEGDGFKNNKLQTLSTLQFIWENDEHVLRCFPHLKRLKCEVSVLKNQLCTYHGYPALHFLSQLESLSVTETDSNVEYYRFCLDDLSFPLNLKKLTLCGFPLHNEEMSIIGRLQKLEVLKLRWCYMKEGSPVWGTNDDEFQQLKFLELNKFQVKQWNAESEHFPLIERLVLWNCEYLMEIPSSFGNISTLQMIKVGRCKKSVADSALEIQEVQKDMGNEELKEFPQTSSTPY